MTADDRPTAPDGGNPPDSDRLPVHDDSPWAAPGPSAPGPSAPDPPAPGSWAPAGPPDPPAAAPPDPPAPAPPAPPPWAAPEPGYWAPQPVPGGPQYAPVPVGYPGGPQYAPVPGVSPPAGYPYLPPPPLPPPVPPGVPRLRPERIDPVPGTSFGVVTPALHPTVSGLAVGSMVAGIGAAVISLSVLCAGLSGSSSGALVGGAFAALTGAIGIGAAGTAFAALREIRGSGGQITGRGLAITGLSCGGAGFGLAAIGMLLAVALSM